jgi:hypothetical protein
MKKLRRKLRYARRMSKAAAGQFAREERGTVMALTIAFALPICMFVFGSFNVGGALVTRMRAQNVADAASYTGALWHARFLNYCAYTRRHIIGNYATIALSTAYVNNHEILKNIDGASNLTPTRNNDSDNWVPPSISNQIMPAKTALDVARTVIDAVRTGSDQMNKWLSASQWVMYQSVGDPNNVMAKVVEDFNGRQGTEFELDTNLSFGTLKNEGLVSYKKLGNQGIKETKAYLDPYTTSDAPGPIATLSRIDWFVGGYFGMYHPLPKKNEMNGFIRFVNVKSTPVSVKNHQMKTESTFVPFTNWYTWFLFWVDTPWGPVPVSVSTPFFGEKHTETYTLNSKFNSTKVYEMIRKKEPEVLAVVKTKMNTAPFFSPMQLRPQDLFPTQPIRAFSRSKAYFKGWNENIKRGKYQNPDLNYPFWGAKLADLQSGGTGIQGVLQSQLGPRYRAYRPNY